MRLLWFNLATDADDPVLGFTSAWIRAVAQHVEFIHVVTMREGRTDLPSNVRVHSVGKEKGYSEPRRAMEFYRSLLSLVRHERFDACFSHMIPLFTVLGAPPLKLKGIPIVTWYAHPSLTWMLRGAHWLSFQMVASLSTAYPYRHDKLHVLGQGIDTDLFSPAAGTAADTPINILCVGRLSPVKDHPTLLDAVDRLWRRGLRPLRVVLLGGPLGPSDERYARSLRHEIEKRQLTGVVSIHPAVPPTELPPWYRRASVHVNLTPTGSGDKVAWEAMSCGAPCLAANEGFRETFGTYADQLLFPFGDASALADRIDWALSLSADQRRTLGAYLRDQVVHYHSLERLGDKLTQLLRSATAST